MYPTLALSALTASQFPTPKQGPIRKALLTLGHPVQTPAWYTYLGVEPHGMIAPNGGISVSSTGEFYRKPKRLAALIAHEERHLGQRARGEKAEGPAAEAEALQVQLDTLNRLGERDPDLLRRVHQALARASLAEIR